MDKIDLVGQPYSRSTNWRALEYFNFYRILLSGLFTILIYADQLPQPLGSLNEKLFSLISHLYLFTTFLFSIFIRYEYPKFNVQIALHVLTDIIILSVLMYSSSGLSSGFGMLIIIAVAGGSILRTGKIAILFAAIATITVLSHEIYSQFFTPANTVNYTHAGILGGTFFISAIIGHLLSTKIREAEALATQQAIEINELANLNEYIIRRLQAGILVIDNQMNILLINESAKYLLTPPDQYSENIGDYVRNLLKKYIDAWLQKNAQQSIIIHPEGNDLELQISFIKLEKASELNFQILVFIEDITELRKQAQRLRLASLGRLTASIAHEIRNPLSAISHAGQLLLESDSLIDEEKHLTKIINEHSIRINSIIENVMSISKRQQSTLEELDLLPWLQTFRNELIASYRLEEKAIPIIELKTAIQIRIDLSQLHQILWNLSENALRYSKKFPYLSFRCDADNKTGHAFIDIIDYGPGITDDIKTHLFEPFFTTETKGSGLGLYLVKELSEANQATLNLRSSSNQGTIFRITFMSDKKLI